MSMNILGLIVFLLLLDSSDLLQLNAEQQILLRNME